MTLLMPQLAQAQRRTELPRFGVLVRGDVASLLKTGLGLHGIQHRTVQHEFATKPINFWLVMALCMKVNKGQSFVEYL